MTIVHIVMFAFKSTLTEADVREACDDFLALQSKCLHPSTNKPYILNASGGRDHSPEGAQNGFTHVFVEEFDSTEDRDYYLKEDPEHQAFVKKHGPQVEKLGVLDYTKGQY